MKAAQWLLCSGNDIIWIVGKRADRRFATSEKTKKTIKINLQ
jgi:tRNA(Ile)-lysidine synthase